MNKTIKSLTAVLLFCGVAMTSCKQEQPKMLAAVYNTMTISTDSRVLENSYSSTIRGCQDIAIYPQVGGTLQRLFVTEGQRVKKGQTLPGCASGSTPSFPAGPKNAKNSA